MSQEDEALRFRRPFGWGILIVGDARGQLPELDRDESIASSDFAVVIPVRHAQDVEHEIGATGDEIPLSEVLVTCLMSPPPPGVPEFDVIVEIPSGRLIIGDADNEASVEVAPGSWRIQGRRTPVEHAEEVELWVTPSP